MNDTQKQLWLLRHGHAERQASSDPVRELTAHGRAQIRAQAAYFVQQNLAVDEIWISPYTRAQQTAQELLQHWSSAAQQITQPLLTPDTAPGKLLELLQQEAPARVLLVSHQPLANRLADRLCFGEPPAQHVESMGTGAVLQLSASDWLPGWAQLDWLRQAPAKT